MLRCVIAPTASRRSRVAWTTITHLGGTGPSVAAAAAPWYRCCEWHEASRVALGTLVASHLAVQLIKRTVGRPRPIRSGMYAALREPDRFSFPSGHAAAAMSVALGYGTAFPAWLVPLLALALLVGFSRVRLGVHFPGDVIAGQVIATVTAIVTLLLT